MHSIPDRGYAFLMKSFVCSPPFDSFLVVVLLRGGLESIVLVYSSVTWSLNTFFSLSFCPWNVCVVAQDCSGSPIAAEAHAEKQQHPKLQNNISQAGSKHIANTVYFGWLLAGRSGSQTTEYQHVGSANPVWYAYFAMSTDIVWWPLGKAKQKQHISLVFHVLTCKLTPSDGHWTKPKKKQKVSLVLACFDPVAPAVRCEGPSSNMASRAASFLFVSVVSCTNHACCSATKQAPTRFCFQFPFFLEELIPGRMHVWMCGLGAFDYGDHVRSTGHVFSAASGLFPTYWSETWT